MSVKEYATFVVFTLKFHCLLLYWVEHIYIHMHVQSRGSVTSLALIIEFIAPLIARHWDKSPYVVDELSTLLVVGHALVAYDLSIQAMPLMVRDAGKLGN